MKLLLVLLFITVCNFLRIIFQYQHQHSLCKYLKIIFYQMKNGQLHGFGFLFVSLTYYVVFVTLTYMLISYVGILTLFSLFLLKQPPRIFLQAYSEPSQTSNVKHLFDSVLNAPLSRPIIPNDNIKNWKDRRLGFSSYKKQQLLYAPTALVKYLKLQTLYT